MGTALKKRALILHAMEQTSQGHWYQWLKDELEHAGYEVWVPDLPNTRYPSVVEAQQFLMSKGWDFQNCLIIGHSSGTLQALYLLQHLPEGVVAKTAVLVSAFDHPLPGMEAQHQKLFSVQYSPEDIKRHAKNLLFIHAKDDPWCPLEGMQSWCAQLGASSEILATGGHFSTSLDPQFSKFPQLLKILKDRSLL